MKHIGIRLAFFALMMLPVVSLAQLKLQQGDELYIKAESENLRLSPNGTVICKLPQGSKVIAIEEESGWVAVHLVGYIWKGSLTNSRFDIPGFNMRALHIMVKTDAEAKEIKALLDGGADFKQLAKERSIGPNAENGGDLGIINKGDFLPELDKALSSLNVGQISDVVKSSVGYHIFKRVE
ncbi:MAG: peptidylprolyl isomerase [Candidatus Zhuqueibacterota bacterium]